MVQDRLIKLEAQEMVTFGMGYPDNLGSEILGALWNGS
jgi:hypothetical protein